MSVDTVAKLIDSISAQLTYNQGTAGDACASYLHLTTISLKIEAEEILAKVFKVATFAPYLKIGSSGIFITVCKNIVQTGLLLHGLVPVHAQCL